MRRFAGPMALLIGVLAGCSSGAGGSASRTGAMPQVPSAVPTEEYRAFGQERDAQALLGEANGVASRYYERERTFEGFDAAAGRALEPKIRWTSDEGARTMEVAVAETTDEHILLVTEAETGEVYCQVGGPGSRVISAGSKLATKASHCSGGWG